MRFLLFLLALFVFVSCGESENCDINNYPGPPFGNPDDTVYYDSSVRYLYACYSSGFNRVVTYEIVDSCWEVYSLDEYNMNCN